MTLPLPFSMPDPTVDLSVVVPVHNAARHLPALTARIRSLRGDGLRCQTILVDDGSSDDSAAVMRDLAQANDDVIAMSTGGNRGAGIARNLGWRQVTGRYVLFFDADDHLHPEVVAPCLAVMDRTPEMDTALFAYRYTRGDTDSFTAMSFQDERILRDCLGGQSHRIAALASFSGLLRFTNYPWNKILRTARFRATGLSFGSTMVHNDMLGHWHSLLSARQIMVCAEVICTHVVHPTGANLTNRFGQDRLQMLTALREVYDMLEADPALRHCYSHHFWELARTLTDWARPRMSDALRPELDTGYTRLLARMDLGDLARMRTRRSPDLARSIVTHLLS